MEIVKNIFSRSLNNCIDAMFPPVCISCEAMLEDVGRLCPQCWSEIQMIDKPICPITGTPLNFSSEQGMISPAADMEKHSFDRICSAFLYEGIIQQLIHQLKFADRTDLAPWLAEWMYSFASRVTPELLEEDIIVVPVPMHYTRAASRFFNQSSELARTFCKFTKQEYRPDMLHRIRHTTTQMGLSRKARLKNLKGAFAVPEDKKDEIKGKKVLLIDDVFTTGSTIEASSMALKRAGVEYVAGLTLARVA